MSGGATGRSIRGLIGYFAAGRAQTGREIFSIDVRPGGARTLRAQCELDDERVLRDVVLTLDPQWRPTDAFVRVLVSGALVGSSWFLFSDEVCECEAFTAREGRVAQTVRCKAWPRVFGSHSLVNDCWFARTYDQALGGEQLIRDQPVSSQAANGATGPLIHLMDFTIAHVGAESLAVPAGQFATDHYRIRFGEFPALDLWVHGQDCLFVREHWDFTGASYELLALEQD
jgi:hypothetical protein